MTCSFKIVKLTEAQVPGAVEVLRQSFFPDEKVCNCVNLLHDSPEVFIGSRYKCTKGSLELESLAVDTVKDGFSLVAVDVTDETVVLGAAFNKLQVKPSAGELGYFEKFAADHIRDKSALALVQLMIEIDSRKDLFEHFNVDCGLEIMFLAVKSTTKGLGIGQALIEESIKLAKTFEGSPKPEIVTAIFTSKFSQKAGYRAGMKAIVDIPYTEFSYNGRTFSEVTGPDHPTCTLSAIKVCPE